MSKTRQQVAAEKFVTDDPVYTTRSEMEIGYRAHIAGSNWGKEQFAPSLQLAAAVQKMREAQRRYFSYRNDATLKEAKRQEILVDDIIKKLTTKEAIPPLPKNPETDQGTIF